MTQGERVKIIRKEQCLTLEKFGKKLGVTKVAISNIENGNRNLTNQMILSICREFGVNEEWLRDGTCEMFLPLSRSEIIADFAGDLMKDEEESFRRRLIEALAKLDESGWDVLEKIADDVLKKD